MVTARRTREDVLEVAGRLFSQHGYHGTSMRDLGRELGLLGSSLYSHVGGKEELLVEIIRRGAQAFEHLVEEVQQAGGSPTEQLRRLIEGHVRIVIENLHESTVFLNEARFLSPQARHSVIELRDRYEEVFREVLRRGMAEGEFRADLDVPLTGIAILSMLNAVTRWYRPDGRVSPDELALIFVDLTMRGVS